jgi:dsDNA-specific endonuclease/ATPase MutS2
MTLVPLVALIGMALLVAAMVLREVFRTRARAAGEIHRAGRIEDSIDLHAFAPRDVPGVVEAYLEAAVRAGLREVRVIHGKGKGVQRRRAREVLAASPLVEDFQDAPPGRGAWGATIVWLKAPTSPRLGGEPSRPQ